MKASLCIQNILIKSLVFLLLKYFIYLIRENNFVAAELKIVVSNYYFNYIVNNNKEKKKVI